MHLTRNVSRTQAQPSVQPPVIVYQFITVQATALVPEAVAPPPRLSPDVPARVCRRGPDFRSVVWAGVSYEFTALQAAVVSILWEAWENCTPSVGGEYLLEHAGSDSNSRRVDEIFHKHPAWGTMIVQGKSKGSYRLCNPE